MRYKEELMQEKLSPKRTHMYTRFISFLCALWQVTEVIFWWLSLFFGREVMAITSGRMDARTQLPNLATKKAPSLLERLLLGIVCKASWMIGRESKSKRKEYE